MSLLRQAVRLALADLLADWLLGLCTMLALAAVLAPLIVLAGLRAGVVDGLRDLLLQDAHVREVVTIANRSFEQSLFDALVRRPDVSFVAPRTRSLSATMVLSQAGGSPNTRVELLPSGYGDPLIATPPQHANEIVLSTAAASRINAQPGQILTGSVARVKDGRREMLQLPLRVVAIAPPSAFGREGAFVTLDLAVLVEDFQDGTAGAPDNLAEFSAEPRQSYAGFRLYARTLEDVPKLDSDLRAMGIDIVSRASDVANLLSVDRSLRLLFAMVAAMGGSGFLVSLGAGLWANVERKRVSLALLQFLGLHRAGLALFPLVQALTLSGLGAMIAIGAALLAQQTINVALAGTLAINRPLCVISPALMGIALGGTLAGALIVTLAASLRAARLEPWEGVSTP